MEVIVPIGIIIYIVLAVLSALMKALPTHPQPSVPHQPPVDESEAEAVPMPVKERAAAKRQPATAQTEYERFPQLPSLLEQPRSAAERPGLRPKVSKGDLKQAVIMSEVLREPRARRPWPAR